MTRWHVRGYVPDSEDDEISSNENDTPAEAVHRCPSTQESIPPVLSTLPGDPHHQLVRPAAHAARPGQSSPWSWSLPASPIEGNQREQRIGSNVIDVDPNQDLVAHNTFAIEDDPRSPASQEATGSGGSLHQAHSNGTPPSTRRSSHPPSSPLSPPPANLTFSAQREESLLGPAPRSNAVVIVTLPSRSLEAQFTSEELREDDVARATGRSLRQRNPNQIRPYTIEYEAYRQSARAHGVRPVHIAQQTYQYSGFEDSFEGEHDQSSQYQQSSPQMPYISPHDAPVNGGPMEAGPEDDQDDLPPIEVMMRTTLPRETRHGLKRRKIHHDKRDKRIDKLQAPPTLASRAAVTDLPAGGDYLVNAENASTHYDHGLAHRLPFKARKRQKSFRIPRTLAEDSLPTPSASSEKSVDRQGRDVSSPSTDSDMANMNPGTPSRSPPSAQMGTRPGSMVVVSSGSECSSSGAMSDDEAPSKSHTSQPQYRKRIRGVLPASWLRLDHQVQAGQRLKDNLQDLPRLPHASPQKGVARRVSLSHDHSGSAPVGERRDRPAFQTFDTSSEEDFRETPTDQGASPVQAILSPNQGVVVADDGHSDVELSREGQMAKRTVRDSRRSEGKRKRQTRLDKGFARIEALPKHHRVDSGVRPQIYNPNSSRRKHAKHTGKHRKQWVRRKFSQKLSILEAITTDTQSAQPAFVKLAKRRAREQKDLGRQSPSKKLLSLHTQQDGADIDAVLYDWYAGRLRRPTSTAQAQEPENPESGLAVPSLESSRIRTTHVGVQERKRGPSGVAGNGDDALATNSPRKKQQARIDAVPMISLSKDDDPFRADLQTTITSRTPTGAAHQQSHAADRRQGQLEQLQAASEMQSADSAFQRGLMSVNRGSLNTSTTDSQDLGIPLRRFLADVDKGNGQATRSSQNALKTRHLVSRQPTMQQKPRLRKRQPRRFCPEQLEPHRPSCYERSPEPIRIEDDRNPLRSDVAQSRGLLPYGSSYTTDFDITPLPTGVCFRSTSFIGSGEFARALNIHARSLDETAGSTIIDCGPDHFRFGTWDEECSSNFRKGVILCQQICCSAQSPSVHGVIHRSPAVQETAQASMRGFIRYFNTKLNFTDPIDRRFFVTVVADSLEVVLNVLQHDLAAPEDHDLGSSCIEFLTSTLVLAHQACQVAQHAVVPDSTRSTIEGVRDRSCVALSGRLFTRSRKELIDFHDPVHIHVAREFGIRDTNKDVEALVCLYYTSTSSGVTKGFWTLIHDAWSTQIHNGSNDVTLLEIAWHQLFAVLPLLEIDQNGVLKPGLRAQNAPQTFEDCGIVKALLVQTFAWANSATHHPTLNAYIRALLTRCFRLIRIWSWHKSELILSCVFEFFKTRGLSFLPTEESNGSTRFLEILHVERVPHIEQADRSFHIFLKMLALGLIEMQNVYPVKKIRSLAWRFVPAHGRAYEKDQELHRDQLDALRNHHDLLATLYYASPSGFRPSLTTLKNLVDFSNSHAEVCKVGVRSWSNLTRYQVSTNEPLEGLNPFITWFNEIVSRCLQQHQYAQTEATLIMNDPNKLVAREVLQVGVARNQMQIESVVECLVESLRSIMRDGSNASAACYLFEGVNRNGILEIGRMSCNKTDRCNRVMIEAYLNYLTVFAGQQVASESGQDNDDSQDYGNIDLDDVDSTHGQTTGAPDPQLTIASELEEQVVQDLTAFPKRLDDAQTELLISTFTKVAAQLVERSKKDWLSYLDSHGSSSWFRMPEIDRRNSMTPWFFACVIEEDPSVLDDHATAVMNVWIDSLVERTSLLKYQHKLTSSLLNTGSGDPILRNLPFAVSEDSKLYEVSLDEIKLRRISLLSSIISNTRQDWEETWFLESNRAAQQRRDRCIAMIKALMAAMKRKYQETQADSSAQGGYVDFVHTVVQLLHQHVAFIQGVSIDKFFTNSGNFPLPESDPLYVVGRLRSYEFGLGIADVGRQKMLVKFVQTLVEKAAAEQQQTVLTDHVVEAVCGTQRHDTATKPSLWTVMLGKIIPGYLRSCVVNAAGWYLASPMLKAAKFVVIHLMGTSSEKDKEALMQSLSVLHKVLAAALQALGLQPPDCHCPSADGTWVADSVRSHFVNAGSLRAVQGLFDIVIAAAPFLDLTLRQTRDTCAANEARTLWRYVEILAGVRMWSYEKAKYCMSAAPDSVYIDGGFLKPRRDISLSLTEQRRDHGRTCLRYIGDRNQDVQRYLSRGAIEPQDISDFTTTELYSSLKQNWDCGWSWVQHRRSGSACVQLHLELDDEEERLLEKMQTLRRLVSDAGVMPFISGKNASHADAAEYGEDQGFNDLLAELVV